MPTFNITGTKIDYVPYSISCGPLAQAGVFSNLTKTLTMTGVLDASEFVEIGNINNFLAITLMFDSSETDIEDTEVPTINLTSAELLTGVQISKMSILGTKITSGILTNNSSRKIVYNLTLS